jgi:hypothetical protein
MLLCPKPKFERDNEYYCNGCKLYKDGNQFYSSWIEKRQRQCKECAVHKINRQSNIKYTEKLLQKLKCRLRYYGHSNIASSLQEETIILIATENKIFDVSKIKRITSPKSYEDCLDIKNYRCEIHK